MGIEDILEIKKRIAFAKNKQNQRKIDEEEKQEIEEKENEVKKSAIEQEIKKDIRWQEMVKVANNPLLKAALTEYFNEVGKKRFRLKIEERVGYSLNNDQQKAVANRWMYEEPEIIVNGISIKSSNQLNKLKIEVYVEHSNHEDDPDWYLKCESVDELIDFIITCIAKKQKIRGLESGCS